MKEKLQVNDPKNPRVRPRLVWGGMGAAVLGVCASGLGVMMRNGWSTWGGAAVIVVGLLIAWRGGVMYDTRGQEPPHHELQELVEGGEHRGVSPESQAVGTRAEARAAAVTQRKKAALARSMSSPPPSIRRLAAFGLIPVGAWLFIDQIFLGYPFTIDGQDNALRDVGFGVVVVLAALRLRLRTRSLVASSLCVLSGALLILSAIFTPHDAVLVQVNELVTGLVVLGLASLTFT